MSDGEKVKIEPPKEIPRGKIKKTPIMTPALAVRLFLLAILLSGVIGMIVAGRNKAEEATYEKRIKGSSMTSQTKDEAKKFLLLIADARSLRYDKKLDESLKKADEALKLRPDSPTVHVVRAEIFTDRGDYEEGLKEADRAVELAPANAYNYLVRGLVFEKKGDTKKAIADYEKAVKLDRNGVTSETAKESLERIKQSVTQPDERTEPEN